MKIITLTSALVLSLFLAGTEAMAMDTNELDTIRTNLKLGGVAVSVISTMIDDGTAYDVEKFGSGQNTTMRVVTSYDDDALYQTATPEMPVGTHTSIQLTYNVEVEPGGKNVYRIVKYS